MKTLVRYRHIVHIQKIIIVFYGTIATRNVTLYAAVIISISRLKHQHLIGLHFYLVIIIVPKYLHGFSRGVYLGIAGHISNYSYVLPIGPKKVSRLKIGVFKITILISYQVYGRV